MSEPREYWYKDLKPGDAYYGAWQSLMSVYLSGAWLLLIALLCRGGYLYLQWWHGHYFPRIFAFITWVAIPLVFPLSVYRVLRWRCPRCSRPFAHRFSYRNLIITGLIVLSLFVLADSVSWLIRPNGPYIHTDINLLLILLLVGGSSAYLYEVSMEQEMTSSAAKQRIAFRNVILSKTSLACPHCHLPKWAPDDPDKTPATGSPHNIP